MRAVVTCRIVSANARHGTSVGSLPAPSTPMSSRHRAWQALMSATGIRGIPLTVVGGFLGVGKTTLLNNLLRDADRRIAVFVNDFGAINIDAECIRAQDGDTISLTNGCICCGISGEFMFALAGLRDRDDPPDHVIVEASGIGDVATIVRYADIPGYRRDAAIVVVDAETVKIRTADVRTADQVLAQLRAADLVVLNKADLVTADELAVTRRWLGEMVPLAGIVETAFGEVPLAVLLGVGDRPRTAPAAPASDRPHPEYSSWSWAGDAPLDGRGLSDTIAALPDGILRVKGVLHLREDPVHRYLVQLVGRRGSIERDRIWGEGETPGSRLVMVGLPGSIVAERLDAEMGRLVVPG